MVGRWVQSSFKVCHMGTRTTRLDNMNKNVQTEFRSDQRYNNRSENNYLKDKVML